MGLSVLQKWIVEGRALGVNKTGVCSHTNRKNTIKKGGKDIRVIKMAALPTLATSLASDMSEAFFLLMVLLILIFIRHYKDVITVS